MSPVTFDTLQFVQTLKQAGFDVRESIGQSEGGATGYNATYGFGAGKQDEMIRLKFGKKYGDNVQLTDLTIEDALTYARQRGENKGALGRYQFMPDTLVGLLDGAGLSKKDKFSAENQDKLYNVLSNRNASALRESGFQATAENLHLSHFAGAKGAVRILKADPNTLVGTAMGHKEKLANGEDNPVWKTNKSVFYKGRRIEGANPKTFITIKYVVKNKMILQALQYLYLQSYVFKLHMGQKHIFSIMYTCRHNLIIFLDITA
jgi:hypothetical protein